MAPNSHQVASAFVVFFGPVRAVGEAYGRAARAPAHSDRAVFWDIVAREIERGLFAVKPQGGA